MVSVSSADKLERKIYFFRSHIGNDDGGKPLLFDPQPALDVIAKLPFSDEQGGRYWADSDESVLCLLGQGAGTRPRVRYCRVRRAGLPQLERAGYVTDLNIASDEGLLEATHAVFFPGNVVGVEYNHYGPRFSSFGSYLHRLSEGAVAKATFSPILRDDPTRQLDRVTDIRLFDITVRRPYIDSVRQASVSLADTLDTNAQLFDEPEKVQVVLRYSAARRRSAWDILRNITRSLVVSNTQDPILDRFRIRGHCEDSDKVEALDLLKDNIIAIRQVVRLGGRGRAIDADSAFAAIIESYEQFEGEISKGVDASL